ncbi:MAG: hypothetical protein K2J20_05890, partial [Bacilli bacterium]|nr:hypothetical protein [Bacilli bacterium]
MIAKDKSKVIFLIAITILLLTFILVSIYFYPIVAHAETIDAETIESEGSGNDNARGIYAKLSLSINAKNGIVTATVKNDFTIGNSKIPVVVELYSSYTFQEYTSNMQLESRNTTTDLNIFKTISTSCSTNGEQKYWCALMRYKHDSADWIEKVT